jgi:ribosome-binding protein aMBF1 (putative translation factor)
MDTSKRNRLEAAGWKVGSTKDFLHLSNEEETLVELRVALGSSLRQQRTRKRLSQTELAKKLGSSQSRVAKMEAGDPSVTLDLQIRALVSLGATRKEVARAVASGETGASA